MGYTWEGWVLDPQRLVAELTSPQLPAESVRPGPSDEVLVATHQQWGELAGTVARALAAGGGDLTGDLANYVLIVVRTLGSFASSVWHTSSGGGWFRDELLGSQVAAVIGRQLAVHLVVRELGGLTLLDCPMLGWLSGDECRAVAGRLEAFVPDENTSEDLWGVLDAVAAGAERGTGLVTLYG